MFLILHLSRRALGQFKRSHLRSALSLISILVNNTPLRVNHRSEVHFIAQVPIPSSLQRYELEERPWISKYLRWTPHFGRALKAFGIESLTNDTNTALSDSLDILSGKETRQLNLGLEFEISRLDGFYARLLISRNLYSWKNAFDQASSNMIL